MVQKRQVAEEEYDVSPKHLKLEHACDFVSSLQFIKEDAAVQSDKDEGCFFKPFIGVDYDFISGKLTNSPACTPKDVEYALPGRLSTSSWASSMTIEEDVRSATPLQIPDHSPLKPRTLIQPEDAYSYLLGYSPLKEVPVGREYQADIPECIPLTSEVNLVGYCKHEVKLMGSCVISFPEDQDIHDNDTVGRGRTECHCKRPGSLGCVRRHIKEARETLKESIGQKRFTELGFGNMGEAVAEQWTEEDEQLFHQVVYSNPVSIGKNFWRHLEAVFPSRTNQEIVSYYFNVFMLRKRAEQNRCDPPNVDSDDDEWQGSYESEEDYCCRDEIYQYDSFENMDGFDSPVKDHCKDFSIPNDHIGSANFSDSTSQPSEKTMVEESGDGDHNFQYDSCTSSDTAGVPHTSEVHVDSNKSWGSHEFIFDPSDSKVWDTGYFSCSRTNTEFLPTGSMIEEVFGDESWNFEAIDDNKSSN